MECGDDSVWRKRVIGLTEKANARTWRMVSQYEMILTTAALLAKEAGYGNSLTYQ